MIGLSIDPGKSTGICLFEYGESGFSVLKRWQFEGGAAMLHTWLYAHTWVNGTGAFWCDGSAVDALMVEKFTPRDNEGFSLTLDSVEPLVCEGVLIAHDLGDDIVWRQPSQQYFMGASTLPLKKKKFLAREFLRGHNLLPFGKEFGAPDANDATSATLHAIGWLRSIRHMPTLQQLFPEGDAS